MISSKHRVPLASFDFKSSHKLAGGQLLVFFKRNSFPYSRIGVIISKKTASKAVDRNRLRRLTQSWFKDTVLNQLIGWDLVVIIRPTVKVKDDLSKIKAKLLKRLNK